MTSETPDRKSDTPTCQELLVDLIDDYNRVSVERNELMALCVEIRDDLENRGRGENGLVGISPPLRNKLCELTKGR